MELKINQEKVKASGLQLYIPNRENDLHLFRWWMKLCASGDIHEVFNKHNQIPSTFFASLQDPVAFCFSLDDQNEINFAYWITPFITAKPSAFISLWVDKSLRNKRGLFERSAIIHDALFQIYEALYAVCRLERVEVFEKCGYTIAGTFDTFYENAEGYLLCSNKEKFKASKMCQRF